MYRVTIGHNLQHNQTTDADIIGYGQPSSQPHLVFSQTEHSSEHRNCAIKRSFASISFQSH
ncbi:hypothetical protein BLOT_002764 [Blomia tropicalis]|nr:hypothetical protein BLOT_002764 [Blomia tropicalis]